MKRRTTTKRQGGQAIWLLLWFIGLGLAVFMISALIMSQQFQSHHYHGNHQYHHHSSQQQQLLLDLPPEMIREAFLKITNTTSSSSSSSSSLQLPVHQDHCQEEYDRATVHRTPGLTVDDLERSRALIGNRYRLSVLIQILQAKTQPVTVVVCGGSITLGHGVHP